MQKLKKIILHLDNSFFKTIEDDLLKNKADNFLHLYKSYRSNIGDELIIKELNLNTNSYYVLKSRLYDKIQRHLSGDINITRAELTKKLDELPNMYFSEPREITIPYLEKIEKDLLNYDMYKELLTVYSIFKKINLYTDKYFEYSQLYNKYVAYSLSIEKSEEILGNFNRILGQYNFSKSPGLIDTLLFIKKEIYDQFTLNPARQIEIIKNCIDIQLYLFCNVTNASNHNTEGLIAITQKLINELPESSVYKYWVTSIDYLAFEYYTKIGQLHKASVFYNSVNEKLQHILLYSNICCTANFLVSKISFLQKSGRIIEFIEADDLKIYMEVNDTHASVCYAINQSMHYYYKGNLKDAINKLQLLMNENSFKDYIHINFEIKFTLVFFYIQLKEYDIALNLLKSIYRKIKSDKLDYYSNALILIKILEDETKRGRKQLTEKQKDNYTLFNAKNNTEYNLIKHLEFELNKKTN